MEDQKIIELLHDNDLKVTTQRLLVSKYILSRTDHPTAEQVYNSLKEEYPTLSLATVYKTLNMLKGIGLLQELGFAESPARYDPNVGLHINMICTTCDAIKDFHPENISDWWHEMEIKLDVKPVGQRIDVYYRCESCKNKKK